MLTLTHQGPLSIAGITGDANDVVIDAINYVDDFLTPPEYSSIRVANLSFVHFDTNDNSALMFLRGAHVDLQNLVFRDNLTATYIWLNRFYWARMRNIEAYNTAGKVFDAYTRPYPALGPADPPGVLLVEDLYAHDNVHTTYPWPMFNLSGDGAVPFDRAEPWLQATFDRLVIEGNSVGTNMFTFTGPSYRAEFNDLEMRDNTAYTSQGCGLANGVSFIGGYRGQGALKQISFTNPTMEDNVIAAGIYNGASGSVDPRDSQLRITGGSIVRNTTCDAAVVSGGSVGIRGTDFGEGADTNLPFDFGSPCGLQDVAPGEVIRQSMPEAWTRPWCP
jgi:hypothetical protein